MSVPGLYVYDMRREINALRAEVEALRARVKTLAEALERLNKRGGLGLDAHAIIDAALAAGGGK